MQFIIIWVVVRPYVTVWASMIFLGPTYLLINSAQLSPLSCPHNKTGITLVITADLTSN